MFLHEYKATVKNLFRSAVFWLLIVILVIIAVYEATEVSYSYYDPATKETIEDTDPRYVLSFQTYVQTVMNACVANIMMYGMPLVTVIFAVLVLFRDHGDGFFEIQKAGGIRPSCYLFSRICALLTVSTVVAFLATALSLHVYIITRGGVADHSYISILADSLVRILRVIVCIAFPCIALYTTLTYAVGCIFKNGIAAAVAGLGYAIFYYAVNLMFRFRVASWYFDYLSPLPEESRRYFIYFGSEWHANIVEMMGASLEKALLAIGCLVAFALVYTLVSYVCVKKRSI